MMTSEEFEGFENVRLRNANPGTVLNTTGGSEDTDYQGCRFLLSIVKYIKDELMW